MSNIEKIINDAWEIKDQINKDSDKSITDAVKHILKDLDQGKIRVAEKNQIFGDLNVWLGKKNKFTTIFFNEKKHFLL